MVLSAPSERALGRSEEQNYEIKKQYLNRWINYYTQTQINISEKIMAYHGKVYELSDKITEFKLDIKPCIRLANSGTNNGLVIVDYYNNIYIYCNCYKLR